MTIYWPFFGPLAVICLMAWAISAATGNGPMARVASVLALNWAINTAFCLLTGLYDPWPFFFAIDALSCAAILWPPAGKVQALIGWTYIGEIVLHLLYGLAARPGAEHLYWAVLTEVGLVQLALLGGWAVGYGGHRLWCRWRMRLSRDSRPAGMA